MTVRWEDDPGYLGGLSASTGSLEVGEGSEVGDRAGDRGRQSNVILGFEGRDHKPRHASGLWRLKKARTWV